MSAAATVLTRPTQATEGVGTAPSRLASVDAYRGLVMLLIFAELLRSCLVAAAVPFSRFIATICDQQTHVAWVGASLHDLIQPSFYLLVGIGLFYSMRRREASGSTMRSMAGHVATRSLILIVVGIALVSIHPRQWRWWFDDTLTQIGLAYPFLFLIARRPKRDWGIALTAILAGYWLWFAVSPLPPPGFDYSAVGVPHEWIETHGLTGFAAHWQIGTNPAATFDRWFLNLFPIDTPFVGELNGLTTLNFIPSLGTMILGLFAATVLSSTSSPAERLRWLSVAGAALVFVGWLLGALGVCPVVKAIWTPSWVLFSGGLCFLLLAAFYAVVDVIGLTSVAFPLRVIGTNSMLAYVISQAYPAVAFNSLQRMVGPRPFAVFGAAYQPMVYGAAVLTGYWLMLYVLYRRRIFVRV